ncbi:hypothetical protein LLUL007_09585 [Lactococcus cremoris]
MKLDTDRMAKYNQLLRIEDQLAEVAQYKTKVLKHSTTLKNKVY